MSLQALKELLIENALFYGQELNRVQIQQWPHELMDLGPEKVAKGIAILRREPSRFRMPMPAEIRAKVSGPVADESVAEDVANRVWAAIARRGLYWSHDKNWPQCAIEELGTVAWEVIQRWGGWQSLVLESGEAESGTMRAQLRKSAASVIQQSRAGTLHTPPQLENKAQEPMKLTRLGDLAIPSPKPQLSSERAVKNVVQTVVPGIGGRSNEKK